MKGRYCVPIQFITIRVRDELMDNMMGSAPASGLNSLDMISSDMTKKYSHHLIN